MAITPAPVTTTNNATTDPNLADYLNRYKARAGQLASNENAPLTQDTNRLIDVTNQGVANQAIGAQNALSDSMARSGIANDMGQSRNISDLSQMLQAKNTANLQLERQRAQDATNLRRGEDLNSYLLGGQSAFRAPGEMNLAQQGMGLQQLQFQNGQSLAQSQMQIQQQQFAAELAQRQREAEQARLSQLIQNPPATVPNTSYSSGSSSYSAPAPVAYKPPSFTGFRLG